MSEIVYHPEVRCEVSEGWRDTEITVCVRDATGLPNTCRRRRPW